MVRATLEYKAKKEDENKTVEFICRRKLCMSAGVLTETKVNGGLFLSGKPCKTTDRVSENDIITADVTENTPSASVEPRNINIEVLYDDAFYTVINKPRNERSSKPRKLRKYPVKCCCPLLATKW